MKKVFLSSTYNDLIEHRKAAHDALEQLGLHVIWMEAFGARPVESTQACLDEIEDCDLFVGIYAHRYGHIPTGASISITEQEFDHAQKLGKPVFGFIVNEDHPWPPRHIEHDKQNKLNALLRKVKKQPVEFFTTPDHLANNIASSVGRYLSEHKPAAESPYQIAFNSGCAQVDLDRLGEQDIPKILIREKKSSKAILLEQDIEVAGNLSSSTTDTIFPINPKEKFTSKQINDIIPDLVISKTIDIIGSSLSTISRLYQHLETALINGCRIRIIVNDTSPGVLNMLAFRSYWANKPEQIENNLRSNTDRILSLKKLQNRTNRFELRTIPIVAPFGLFNIKQQSGLSKSYVQLMAFRDVRQPIIELTNELDEEWIEFFGEQFESMWLSSVQI